MTEFSPVLNHIAGSGVHRNMKLFAKVAAGVWPFALIPVFFWLTARSYLNFGGGEKDILLVVPAFVVALFYLVIFVILVRRGMSIGRAVVRATGFAALALILLGVLVSVSLGVSTPGTGW